MNYDRMAGTYQPSPAYRPETEQERHERVHCTLEAFRARRRVYHQPPVPAPTPDQRPTLADVWDAIDKTGAPSLPFNLRRKRDRGLAGLIRRLRGDV